VHNRDFINIDDNQYIVTNPHVTGGLNWQTVWWSLTTNDQANWHPLTWLSHALDCQLFGLDAGYHHIISVVIHSLNVLLLFLLLQYATKAVGRSFVVAALFAWHPFNVESVYRIADRKKLLSTLFFMLAIGAYCWYARSPHWKRYITLAGIFVLALASKPMVVTLPFLLLLLDYWPLRRVAGWTESSSQFPSPQQPVSRLLLEKAPLFALSAVGCALTIWAQRTAGAVRSLQLFPLRVRLGNALDSYVIYVWKTFWPFQFRVFYLHPAFLPWWKPAAAAVALGAISVAIWNQRVVRPYLPVGWLWYLGTLVPVIGIVQVGDQAMADRYAYIPLIGIFVLVIWGATELFDRYHVGKVFRWVVAFAALAFVSFRTFQELDNWKDSVSVWDHEMQVTGGNLRIEKELAISLMMDGKKEEAMPHLLHVASLDPADVMIHGNLGEIYETRGRVLDAAEEYETVVKLTDHKDLDADDLWSRASSLLNLGFIEAAEKDYPKAVASLQEANRCYPNLVDQTIENTNRSLATEPTEGRYLKLSLLLRAKGKNSEASSTLEDAVRAHPGYLESQALLNYLNANPR
jgi:protein O-mannosyl-transferase